MIDSVVHKNVMILSDWQQYYIFVLQHTPIGDLLLCYLHVFSTFLYFTLCVSIGQLIVVRKYILCDLG